MRRALQRLLIAAIAAVFVLALYVDVAVQRFTPETQLKIASTLNLPFTFSSGGVIYASQMNANFEAIRAVVNALDDQNIANASITGSTKLIDGTVTLAKLAGNSVNSSKIVDASIVAGDIADGAIVASKIPDGSITSAKITDATVASVDLADAGVAEVDIDFASAPTNNYNVFFNGTKLDYRQEPWSGTCFQIFTARGSHTYIGGSASTNYTSWIDQTPGGTTVEATPLPLRNPTVTNFRNLYVVADSTPPVNTTFTLRSIGVDSGITCTINSGGPTTCVSSATIVNASAQSAWILKTTANLGAGSRAYSAYICTSPLTW
jgi:hypothetical protein